MLVILHFRVKVDDRCSYWFDYWKVDLWEGWKKNRGCMRDYGILDDDEFVNDKVRFTKLD